MNGRIAWLGIVSSIILLSGITGITIYQDVFAADEKTTICHKAGTKAEKEMQVSGKALEQHLAHGDKLGSCDNAASNSNDDSVPTTGFTMITCECELNDVSQQMPDVCTQIFCSDNGKVNSFCDHYCIENGFGEGRGATCVNFAGCTLP